MFKRRLRRRRLGKLCRRLAALQEESVSPSQAAQVLAAEGALGASDTAPNITTFTDVLRPEASSAIAEYAARSEAALPASKTLRFLATELSPIERSSWPAWLIEVELGALTAITFVYGIFVFPAYDTLFKENGADLPDLTRFIFTLTSPSAPFVWILLVLTILVLAWRIIPSLLGPLTRVVDRLLLASPAIGRTLRAHNSDALAGWLGHAGSIDHDATRLALRAMQECGRQGLAKRACKRLQVAITQGRSLRDALTRSRDFDPGLGATIAAAEADPVLDLAAALRARWLAEQMSKSDRSRRAAVIVQLFLGILVGMVVLALYLPLFRISLFF